MTVYARPTLEQLRARVIGDISGRTDGSAYIRAASERVLAMTQAGVGHGLHGHLEWNVEQISPVTCDIDGLVRWGAVLKNSEGEPLSRNAATAATRYATFTGTGTTALPSTTALVDASGAGWTVTTGGNISGGTVEVLCTADDAGAAGNLDTGATLSLVSPISGIDTDGTVAATEATDGSDIEDPEDYRERILDNLRDPPSGGGPGDYVKWAKEVAGVTRAWEFGNRNGIGTVSLAFARDGDPSPIPSSGEIAAVQAYVDARKPLDMFAFYATAPIEKAVNLTIALVPDTAEVRAAVEAELAELFKDTVIETALPQSQIDEAISTAEGETSHEITVISSLTASTWELLTLGTVSYA